MCGRKKSAVTNKILRQKARCQEISKKDIPNNATFIISS